MILKPAAITVVLPALCGDCSRRALRPRLRSLKLPSEAASFDWTPSRTVIPSTDDDYELLEGFSPA